MSTQQEPEAADHVTLSRCGCGTIRLHLRRADGTEFAVAPFDPLGALNLALSVAEEVEASSLAGSECVGHA